MATIYKVRLYPVTLSHSVVYAVLAHNSEDAIQAAKQRCERLYGKVKRAKWAYWHNRIILKGKDRQKPIQEIIIKDMEK